MRRPRMRRAAPLCSSQTTCRWSGSCATSSSKRRGGRTVGSGRRVLITGHRGYIGSVMAPCLVEAGYEVVGLDTGYFDECTLVPDEVMIPSIAKDIRDVTLDDLRGFDAVVH